jgi:hypothetical protein
MRNFSAKNSKSKAITNDVDITAGGPVKMSQKWSFKNVSKEGDGLEAGTDIF